MHFQVISTNAYILLMKPSFHSSLGICRLCGKSHQLLFSINFHSVDRKVHCNKISHVKLLHNLQHYGIRSNTHTWISSFLKGRTQTVVVDGSCSTSASVVSGVRQGTVLAPTFLLHINDLPFTCSAFRRWLLTLPPNQLCWRPRDSPTRPTERASNSWEPSGECVSTHRNARWCTEEEQLSPGCTH